MKTEIMDGSLLWMKWGMALGSIQQAPHLNHTLQISLVSPHCTGLSTLKQNKSSCKRDSPKRKLRH